MATPGQLVLTMAGALGVSAATVALFDRVLAEHGLRSKSGRGTSAAKVNARDAANLLISILGSPMEGAAVKAAATTCRTYSALPLLSRASSAPVFGVLGCRKLHHCPRSIRSVTQLQTLIAGVAEEERFLHSRRGRRADHRRRRRRLAIRNYLSVSKSLGFNRSFLRNDQGPAAAVGAACLYGTLYRNKEPIMPS